MSYRIEQTQEQTNNAFAFLSQADLDAVRLVESSAASKIRPGANPTDLVFDIDFSPESTSIDGRNLIVLTRFAFSIRAANDETSSNLIEVFALFEASYSITTVGYIPTEAQIDAFRRGNAIFNCWPYFREYIHSVFVRMGVPPPPVPFLRLMPKQQVRAEDDKALTLQPSEGKDRQNVKKRHSSRKKQRVPLGDEQS